ncbi:MAG: hypothetical protein H6666_02730 [Ardenticatenaceae bacterium]|nr:hypothetical protein [Anaerolineales bacterium]MCB8916816.1 hypothetical protein [Ardenticatenaceae bacterium]
MARMILPENAPAGLRPGREAANLWERAWVISDPPIIPPIHPNIEGEAP